MKTKNCRNTEKSDKGKMIKRTEYRLRVGPHTYYTTKIRKPKTAPIPDYIIDPSYDKIIEIMKGNYNPSDDKPKKKKKKGWFEPWQRLTKKVKVPKAKVV